MATLTSSTLRVAQGLRGAGFSERRVGAVKNVTGKTIPGGDLVSTGDLDGAGSDLKAETADCTPVIIKAMFGALAAQAAPSLVGRKRLPGC